MLVPAGKATDAVINELAELFEKDDIIIDVGNANFRDQIRRAEELEARGLRFLGMGFLETAVWECAGYRYQAWINHMFSSEWMPM